MKRNIILVGILILLVIPLVASQLTFQQGAEADVKVPCINNGSYCSDTSVCNLTIVRPDGIILIDNEIMTFNTSYHNYTLLDSQTRTLGTHPSSVVCLDGSLRGASTFEIAITPSGTERINSGEGISLVAALISMIVVAGFFFITSMRIENPFGKFALLIVSVIMMFIVVLYSMISIEQNLGGYGSIVSGYSTFLFIIKIIISLGVTALVLLTLAAVVRLYKFKRGFID